MANEAQTTKWTPGTWLAHEDTMRRDEHVQAMSEFGVSPSPHDSISVTAEDGMFVAHCGCHSATSANAHLIAAAPELYEAAEASECQLRSLADQLKEWAFNGLPDDFRDEMHELADAVYEECKPHRAALTKARGEQPSD